MNNEMNNENNQQNQLFGNSTLNSSVNSQPVEPPASNSTLDFSNPVSSNPYANQPIESNPSSIQQPVVDVPANQSVPFSDVVHPSSQAILNENVASEQPVGASIPSQPIGENVAPATGGPIPPTPSVSPVEIADPVQSPATSIPDDFEDKPKKKGGGKFILILLILVLLGAGGYYGYTYFIANNDETKSNDQSEETAFVLQKEDETKDFVYEADYSSAIDFDKEAGSCPISAASLHVPYVNLNSEDAKTVNSEIKALYEQAVGIFRVNTQLDSTSQCTTAELAYKYYQNGDVASIVVAYALRGGSNSSPDFYTYNISTTTGELITDYSELKKLSNQAEATDQEMEALIKTAATENLAANYSNATIDSVRETVGKTTERSYTTGIEYLANLTVDNYVQNVADGKLKVYISDNNNLGFVLQQYTLAEDSEFDKMYVVK